MSPTARTLIIVLPLPPAGLSPNSRTHWAAKAKLTKKYRDDATLATADAILRSRIVLLGKPFAARVELSATFYFRTKRKRDSDNLIGSLKNARDGIADALKMDDSAFSICEPVVSIDKSDPRVVLTVREISEVKACG